MQIVTSFFSLLTSVTRLGRLARLVGVGSLGMSGLGVAAETWVAETFQLAPEVDKRWQEWMEAARPLRVQKETERMAGVIAGLQKNHGLDEAKVKVLQGVVPGLVKETVRDWEQFLRQIHRPAFQGTVKEGLEAMAVFKQDPVTMMAGHEIAFYLLPQERAAFVKAVSQVLPGEVFERWEAGRMKRGEDRKKQAREWVEAGIQERKPAKIYAGELAKILESGLAILGKDSEEGKSMVKLVETWGAAYEGVCREMSLLRVDSFLYPTGPGWVESQKRGCFLFLPRRIGVINAHRELLKKMTLEGGGGAQLAELAKRWEPEDFKLEPVVDLAWEAQMKQAREQHRKVREEKFGKEVDRLREVYGLSEAGAVRLRAEGPELAKAVLPVWEQSMRSLFRYALAGESGVALAKMKDRYGPGVLAGFPAPVSQETVNSEAWEKLIKRELSAEGFAQWMKDRDEGLKKREEEMRKLVAAGREKYDPEKLIKEAFDRELLAELPQEKPEAEWTKRLVKLVESYGKLYAEACDQRVVLWLEARDHLGATWQTARKNGYYYSTLPVMPWVVKYRDELLKLLPEEVRLAQARAAEERLKRIKAATVKARLMVLELMTPLDATQRAALEVSAAELPVEAEDPLMNPNSEPHFWRVWKSVEGSRKLYEILDDRQERLVAKGLARLEQGNNRTVESGETAPVVLRHPALGPADKRGVEAVISQHLATTSHDQSLQGLEAMMKEVDLVVRVLGLDEAMLRALELAAKGTAQRAAEAYRVNQGRYLRSQVQGATPETIRERLKTVGGYSFYMGREGSTLVEETLDDLINEAQRKQVEAYQDEVKARRQEAILQVILARLEQSLSLSGEQQAKLAEHLREVMEKYAPDIERNFQGWGQRMPWYLQSYYMMLPAAGVAEADLKGLLSERQRAIWDEEVTQRGGSYWGQVLEYHEQRKNELKGQGTRRRIFFEP